MHIHRGAAGVNGPVVVDFAHAGSAGPFDHVRDVARHRSTDEIAANPLGFYLNAHTATVPGRRGQGPAAAQGNSRAGSAPR